MSAPNNFRTLSFILLILFGFNTAKASIHKIFKKDEKVPLLRFADIISTHHVQSEMDCSFRCVSEAACVGFKYKHGVSSPSVNCQLSNTTGENNMVDDDDQDWVYFVDIKAKLVTQKISTIETLTTTETNPTGKSCLDIKEKGFSQGDGIYLINPDGEGEGSPFKVKCDITSFGGGWTMCYTTDSQWWRVDFVEEIPVSRVLITNRVKVAQRLSDFAIKIGNSLENDGLSNPKCAGDRLSVSSGETKTFLCKPAMLGQYLVIQSYHEDVLTLCEVEVYAYS